MEKILNKLVLATCLLMLSACSINSNTNSTEKTSDVLTIYLVRHAEKTTQRPDPGLTEAGKKRALELVNVLRNKGLTAIYSSDYIRTKETARPTAELFNLDVQLYNPRDLPGIAKTLTALSGSVLVVGHSNTTPQLVELLGGESVSEINEASEYDRLYKIVIQNDKISSELLRYGLKYQSN